MLSVFDVAKTVCDLSGWNLTHLKLQKILYILQMFHIGKYKNPLFSSEFEAWNYGPVEPRLYKRLLGAGAENLDKLIFVFDDFIPKDNAKYPFINELANKLLKKSSSFLINYTHDDRSAWVRVFKHGKKHLKISNEEIKAEYDRR